MKRIARVAALVLAASSFATAAHSKPHRDDLAGYVKAADWATGQKGPVFVELAIKGDDVLLRLRSADEPKPETYNLSNDFQVVLGLLADKHMQFLWGPLTDWAGPSLEEMRDRMIARLQRANSIGYPLSFPTSTAQSIVDYKTQALLQYTDFLMQVGRGAEAEKLLRERLATTTLKLGSVSKTQQWLSLASSIGAARRAQGDRAGAIEQYAFVERSLGDSPFAVNATVNRAASLARSGRYQEALDTIDAAWARMTAQYAGKAKSDIVPGSDRQFAWIRACALAGLGRHQEAEAAFKPVLNDAEVKDRGFTIEDTATLRVRGQVCMADTSSIKLMLADHLQHNLVATSGLWFQPALRLKDNRPLWDAVRSDPRLNQLAKERTRVLPDAMTAALNRWSEP